MLKHYKLKFTNEQIEQFFSHNLYLSLYSQNTRKQKVKSINFSRKSQPYIFSANPFESFEMDLYEPQHKWLNEEQKKYKVCTE